jgi:anaerobic selenocysteine-containing dehydrogenase
MSFAVEGLSELGLEEGFRLHPEDLDELGIKSGQQVILSLDGHEVSGAAKSDPDCPRGAVYVHRPFAYGGIPHRRRFETLYRLAPGLTRVSVRASGNAGPRDVAPPPSGKPDAGP